MAYRGIWQGGKVSRKRLIQTVFPPSVRSAPAIFLPAVLTLVSCSAASGAADAERSAAMPRTSAAYRDHSSGTIMNRYIADRFPGATLLDGAELASAIVGGRFRYREVGSELVLDRPKEVFLAGGQYQIHWLRSISYGNYSIKRGIVSITCADCPYDFLGLGKQRIFFRNDGMLLTAKADGEGSVVELIPEL